MNQKIKVGILGCTGAVGQKLISLLENHPWFETSGVAASEISAGKIFSDRVNWRESKPIPIDVKNLTIKNCKEELDAKILFSGLDSSVAGEIEEYYANEGYAVVSNSKNHRMDSDVPLIIPEINHSHFVLINQQRNRFSKRGFIVTNPNCSTIVMVLALYPIFRKYGLKKVIVSTMQAISGAGYPGVASLDILGNVIPYIKDEEEKMQTEPQKIFGKYENEKIKYADFTVSAMCNRVPVQNGHTTSISFKTSGGASKEDIIKSFEDIENLSLPFSPQKVVQYFEDPARPQPTLDLNNGNGMTVSVGNLRKCEVLDWKLTAFGHNTIRGAAGAAILNAEYLAKNNYII
ncbi:MAG: aspartate-semialdehyde dehydrogenase [Candidatus Kapaibacterium sp.]